MTCLLRISSYNELRRHCWTSSYHGWQWTLDWWLWIWCSDCRTRNFAPTYALSLRSVFQRGREADRNPRAFRGPTFTIGVCNLEETSYVSRPPSREVHSVNRAVRPFDDGNPHGSLPAAGAPAARAARGA